MPRIEVFESLPSPIIGNAANLSGTYARQQFEAGLRWLQSQGVEVEQHVIGAENSVSATDSSVKTAIELQGGDALPVTTVDGMIIGIGGYPTRAELLKAAGYDPERDFSFVIEVTALCKRMGAALAANNLDQFRTNFESARVLGVPSEELRRLAEAAKTAAGGSLQEETLTKLEQFLAFGPEGVPKSARCNCAGER